MRVASGGADIPEAPPVAASGEVDRELAAVLLSNLAVRVPSRAESSLGAAEAELLEAAAPLGPSQVSDAVYTAFYQLSRAASVGNAATLRSARDRVARIDGARIRLPDSEAGRRLRSALNAYAAAWAALGASARSYRDSPAQG